MDSLKSKLEREIKEQEQFIKKIGDTVAELSEKFSEDMDIELKEIEEYRSFIRNPDLQIAIVGAIKAGKSTLMNALLKENIASTEVTPETATLTKFKYSEKNYLKISFYNNREWNELWKSVEESSGRNEVFKKEFNSLGALYSAKEYIGKDEIIEYPSSIDDLKEMVKKYSSSKSKAHYFVKEIEIGLQNLNLPKEVCFVDTPGLNDVVAYRSNITRDYIKRANAVIVCVNADSMRSDEYTTIVKVFENVGKDNEKVFILGTQIDKLNNPERDWLKQKKEWEKYLVPIFKNENLLESNILGVSSYIYQIIDNIISGKEYTENDILDVVTFSKKTEMNLFKNKKTILDKIKEIIKDEKTTIVFNEKKIKEKTNVLKLESILNGQLLEKSMNILIQDIRFRHSILVENIYNKLKSIIERNKESLEYLDMDLKSLEDKRVEKEQIIENIKSIDQELTLKLKSLKKNVHDSIKHSEENLKEELKKLGI